jgi:hypothetical protein
MKLMILQCTWRAIYVQTGVLSSNCNCVVAHMAADHRFDFGLNAPLKNFWANMVSNVKTNQLHDCNSTLCTHLISCRVDYTCFATAPFQVKGVAIANALVFSRHQLCWHQLCWNVTGNIRARSVWWPFKFWSEGFFEGGGGGRLRGNKSAFSLHHPKGNCGIL